MFCGGSCGGSIKVAIDIANEAEENGEEAMVVAVLPDAGNPYLSKFYTTTGLERTVGNQTNGNDHTFRRPSPNQQSGHLGPRFPQRA